MPFLENERSPFGRFSIIDLLLLSLKPISIVGIRFSVGLSQFIFDRELFVPIALFFRGITELKSLSCFVERSSCLLPVNGMMEEELVSEKDVLLLQTGFLK